MSLSTEKPALSVVPTPPPQDGGEVIPFRDKKPTIHLKTLHDVRIEMAKVYRAAKTGEIDSQEGSRLIYMLGSLGKIIEAQEVDERIDAIKRVMDHRNHRKGDKKSWQR